MYCVFSTDTVWIELKVAILALLIRHIQANNYKTNKFCSFEVFKTILFNNFEIINKKSEAFSTVIYIYAPYRFQLLTFICLQNLLHFFETFCIHIHIFLTMLNYILIKSLNQLILMTSDPYPFVISHPVEKIYSNHLKFHFKLLKSFSLVVFIEINKIN